MYPPTTPDHSAPAGYGPRGSAMTYSDPELDPPPDTQQPEIRGVIFDAAAVGMAFISLAGHFIDANPHFCAMTGYSHAELCAMTLLDINHPQDRAAATASLANLRSGAIKKFTAEKRYQHKNGRFIWIAVTGTLLRGPSGKPCGALGIFEDITSKKQAEKLLVESESRFRTLFEQSPLSVQLLAKDGRTLQVNTAWMDLWQASRETVENFLLRDYNILNDQQAAALGLLPYFLAAIAGKPGVTPPIYYDPARLGVMGRPRWSIGFVHPIKDERGEVREVMLIQHDITEAMATQEQLRKAKESAESANRLKSAFLANMSHEIRTPLGAILGFAQLLRESNQAGEEANAYLDTILRNSTLLHRIIDDIIDLSRVEAGSLSITVSEFDAVTVLSEVMTMMKGEAKKKNLSFTAQVRPGTHTMLSSDPIRLKQILINLVGNALKFTDHGGIGITIEEVEAAEGPQLHFLIKDTGVGIAPEHEGLLFKTFSQIDATHTRRFSGSGLGLALSRHLARALGGDVTLSASSPDQGSEFRVSHPLSPRTLRQGATTAPKPLLLEAALPNKAATPRLKGLQILVVDDAEDNRFLIRRLLEKREVVVTTAVHGLEAISKALFQTYDLILMDMQMPVLDGFAATSELRRLGYKNAIIAVTAHAMKNERQRCLEIGCNAFLSKPVAFDQLYDLIARLAPASSLPAPTEPLTR